MTVDCLWWTPPRDDRRLCVGFFSFPWGTRSVVVRLRRRWLIVSARAGR